jgi:hypothetical protein
MQQQWTHWKRGQEGNTNHNSLNVSIKYLSIKLIKDVIDNLYNRKLQSTEDTRRWILENEKISYVYGTEE